MNFHLNVLRQRVKNEIKHTYTYQILRKKSKFITFYYIKEILYLMIRKYCLFR